MAKINLLPWREALRKERQQQFYSTLGAFVVITLCVWGVYHFYNTLRVDYQESRNQFLNVEITKLDKKIKEIKQLQKEKERLKARIEAVTGQAYLLDVGARGGGNTQKRCAGW